MATIAGAGCAANDSTVKAGSWGARTVEKIIRIIEKAYDAWHRPDDLPGRLGRRCQATDQVDMFPGRRGAGRIFRTQIRPPAPVAARCSVSVAGGAYIPAFCDSLPSWTATPRRTSAAPGGRVVVARPWGRWAAPGCTARCPAAGISWPRPSRTRWRRWTYPLTCRRNWSSRRRWRRDRDPKPRTRGVSRRASARRSTCAVTSAVVDEDSFFEIHACGPGRSSPASPGWRTGHRRGGELLAL